ncbi:MAG: ABC transporter permease [Chlamydiales bacterium]
MFRDSRPITTFFGIIGAYFSLVIQVLWISFTSPPRFYLIRDQLFSVGVASLPVIAITGFSTGIVLAAQSHFQLSDYGLTGATGLMVTKAMMVELGPVLTAFMVTGRVGSAMCAELGTMRVTEQIDALKSMDINPNRYLVAPRFIAGTLMLPLLTLFSTFMGILGGYYISVYYYDMSPSTYLDPLKVHIDNFDFFSGLVKAFIFGIIIVTISCFRGLLTTGGAQGVGRATTNSVVICYTVILITNFFITITLNNNYEVIARYLPWFVR